MRGNALTDPTVVGLLQPFVVTFWYGHPDDDPPSELRPYIEPRGQIEIPGGRSNVKAVIFDAKGEIAYAFDAMPGQNQRGPFQDTVPRWFRERITIAREKMGMAAEKAAPCRDLRLPDLAAVSTRGIRVFVRLKDPGMMAYYAPVVEVATPTDAEWKALDWPDKARSLDADVLGSCTKFMYPPGVMERQNKQTMIAWKVSDGEGTLSLEPAGRGAKQRYAVLKGRVTLTDEGPDGFSYEGTLEAVLTYAPDKPEVLSVRGTFQADYPRHDPARNRDRKFPLEVAFESLPLDTGK